MAANPGEPNRWAAFGKLVAALLVAGVIAAGLVMPYVGGLALVAGNEAGKFQNTTCTLQESKPPQRTTLLARDGQTVIATLFNQDRVPIPLSQIPGYLQDALVATEDRRFYSHHGVDMRGLIRSAVSTTGGNTQGGSTLTMQYVKQIRYYQAGDDVAKQAAAIAQNLERKIEDARCALYIEETLKESKGTILDNYLNIAFFGEHAFGIETAAQTYFNKPASKLTLGESALLVGMLRAPSAYDPFLNRAAATQRRNEVLQNLVSVGKLTQVQADREMTKPISLATQSPPQVRQGCANASTTVRNAAFFCEYTTHWLKFVGKLNDTQLQTGGLKIVTTLDPKLQNSAQQRIEQTIPAKSPTTAVLPVVDPHTGDILAMATSKHYGARNSTETEQPVFTEYVAQGASTYKLFPLLTALSTGVPSDWELDTPATTAYKSKNCATQAKVTNSDSVSTFSRTETLRTATAKSSNTYFVGLADVLFGCHLTPMVDLATRLGLKGLQESSDLRRQTVGAAIISQQRAQQFVLGSVATSPLEIAGAYAAVANHGKFNAPAPVLSITDSNGSALAVHRSPGVQVIAPQVAAQAVDILQGDTKDQGSAASEFTGWYAKNQSLIAGKTGTMEANQKGKNAAIWFVGMTPNLVAASALINFDASSAPSAGLPGRKPGSAYGSYASRVWLRALQPSLVSRTWSWISPDAVSGRLVPDVTGMELAAANRLLRRDGFVMRQLDAADTLQCPSGSASFGTVGYYGPQRAQPGSIITICPSLGVSQPLYRPAPPPPVFTPGNNRSSTRSGNGTTSGNRNGNRTSTAPSPGRSSGNGGGGNGGGTGNGGGGGGPTRAPGGGRNTRTVGPGG